MVLINHLGHANQGEWISKQGQKGLYLGGQPQWRNGETAVH